MKRLRKYAVSSLWVTLITAILCFLCYFLFDLSFLGSFSGRNSESDVVNFFYSIENHSPEARRSDMDVVILDISSCGSLPEIADAITAVSECEPRIMGIDIIFKRTPTVDPAEYDYLAAAIASVPRLITACRVVGRSGKTGMDYSVEHSFYTEESGIPYGAANHDFEEYSHRLVAGNDTLPMFSWLLADGARPVEKGRYVNYSNKFINVIGADERYAATDFRDKIVIVSDVKDPHDHYGIPFRLEGERRVAGAKLLAYAVSAVDSGDWIRRMHDVWCILIALVFSYIFAVLSFYLDRPEIKYRSLKNRLLRICVVLLLFFTGYWIFTSAGVIVNLVYTMLGVAMVGLSMDLLALVKDAAEKFRDRKKLA